jgi:hypothetical protein
MQSLFAALNKAMEQKIAFLGTFFVIFTISYALLAALDFLPEPVTSPAMRPVATTTVATTTTPVEGVKLANPASVTTTTAPKNSTQNPVNSASAVGELPKSITFDSIGRTVAVLNPASRSVSSLDTALLSGVVRHPDSVELGQNGNVFILGHSSYLPVVHNKNYQAI